jgi:hypothetical protein
MLPCIHVPRNVMKVTGDGCTLPHFTTKEVEKRLSFEKLDREHRLRNRAARRCELRRSGLEALLENAEASLQLSSLILAQLARQENALLELPGNTKTLEAVMSKRQALRTETKEVLRTVLSDAPGMCP